MLLALFSCNKESSPDCFKSNGTEITDVRSLEKFTAIVMNDNVEVNITKGNEYKVEVVAGKNVNKKITTTVEGNTLTIANTNRCNFVRGYKHKFIVNITLPYLEYIENSGVADLRIKDNFTQDSISIRAGGIGDNYMDGSFVNLTTSSHGNGDIYLTGTCMRLFVYTNGTNYIHAEELVISDYTFISTLSLGDCYLNLKQAKNFEYTISRDGNIYYTGNPPVIVDHSDGSGKGKAIRRD